MALTGSLINHIYQQNNQTIAPQVDMGATALMWTDRAAYTIIEVLSPTKIVVQRDTCKRVDGLGMTDSQEYEYTPNPHGSISRVTLRKNGKWITEGQSMKDGTRWVIDSRMEYYDYTF